jgi:dATP pyrophosphohydrolase
MRAAFQILSIPYRIIDDIPKYCVFHRADHDQWQFIAGGGEDNETPIQAAKREIFEEAGVQTSKLTELKSLAYIPVIIISEKHRQYWNKETYVIPEYAFGFECKEDIRLSNEHIECAWLTYDEAYKKLKWDSNRTALFELNCRINHFLKGEK